VKSVKSLYFRAQDGSVPSVTVSLKNQYSTHHAAPLPPSSPVPGWGPSSRVIDVGVGRLVVRTVFSLGLALSLTSTSVSATEPATRTQQRVEIGRLGLALRVEIARAD
jgi:hypothetical protein